eukprot:scaffold3.g6302.t1
MGSKHSHKGKREKSKGSKKDKKEKRSKHHKHHRRRSASADSGGSDSSGSASPRLSVNRQLAMGRAAARATREILAYNYELRRELREVGRLARQLDGGGALDISGLPDPFLREHLAELFGNLAQLRKNLAGQFYKRRGAAESVLSFVAPILEESPESLAAYKRAPKPVPEPQQPAPAPAARGPIGPAAPPPGHVASGVAARQEAEGLVESEPESEGGAGAEEQEQQQQQHGAATAGAAGQQEQEEGEGQEPAPRRVAGPAMPPAELLAAAARMPYPESEPGEEGEEEEELLVGPPPPELAEEVELASMDERSSEVARVMHVLAEHAAKHAGAGAAELAESPPDAYDVLGVVHAAGAAEVKRRYWRLSLLIHPDKCDHPQAHNAFQAGGRAVSVAAKHLQDTELRAAVDERREDARLRRLAAEHVAQQERERQWRVARGEATAEDLAGPAAALGAVARETWMTELPPERQAVAGVMPVAGGFQGFSARGKTGRGDTSDWTMTPQQRALALEGGAGGGGPLLLAGGAGGAGAAAGPADAAKAARTAAVVDSYNAATRKKSLVEQHLERQQKEAAQPKWKKQKTGGGGGKAAGPAAGAGDWDRTAHPWQPWDREKAFGTSGKAADAKKAVESSKALHSRFGSGSQQRTFL